MATRDGGAPGGRALNNRTPLLVVGMHRSGTSLVAGALTRAGWSPGSRLLPPNFDNPRGFFETLDVVELHQAILRRRNRRWFDWVDASVEDHVMHTDEVDRARELVRLRQLSEAGEWGWKDPRTLLFLRLLWLRVLDEPAELVAAVRRPCCVVSSLLHRGDNIGVSDPARVPRRLVELWTFHNNLLLDVSRDLKTTLVVVPDDKDLEISVRTLTVDFTATFESQLLSHRCSAVHTSLEADAAASWTSLMTRFNRDEAPTCGRNSRSANR